MKLVGKFLRDAAARSVLFVFYFFFVTRPEFNFFLCNFEDVEQLYK